MARLVLADLVEPQDYLFDLPALGRAIHFALRVHAGDVSDAEYCRALVGTPTGPGAGALTVFHLGGVMSSAPPDLALRVNLHGTLHMMVVGTPPGSGAGALTVFHLGGVMSSASHVPAQRVDSSMPAQWSTSEAASKWAASYSAQI